MSTLAPQLFLATFTIVRKLGFYGEVREELGIRLVEAGSDEEALRKVSQAYRDADEPTYIENIRISEVLR